MMYCERCNIDFPEGLRYCKWCGQTLTQRRVTGELKSCPSCFAAIQSSWAFCKVCGAQLTGQASEPVSATCPRCNAVTEPGTLNCLRCGEDLTRGRAAQVARADSTSILVHCQNCGEQVDSGSMYCKACGSALYDQPSPFGPSALLCATCNSYSPIGSSLCRVCGATLGEAARPAMDQASGELSAGRKDSSTLPDLAEHLPKEEPEPRTQDFATEADQTSESGAHTRIFAAPDAAQRTEALDPQARSQDETPTTAIRPRRAADTTVLPGVAGSKAEQSGSTQGIHKKDTGPVEGETGGSEGVEEAPVVDSIPTPYATRIDTPSGFFFGEERPDAALDAKPEHGEIAAIDGDGTTVLGSGMAGPAAFETEERRLTSEWKKEPRASHEEIARNEATTGDFGSAVETTAREETTIQLPPSAELQPPVETIKQPSEMATQAISEPVWARKPEPWAAQPTEAQAETQAVPVAPAARKKSSSMIPIIVVVVILAAAGAAVWWFMSGSKPAPAKEQPAATGEPTPQTPTPTTPQTGTPSTPSAPEGMAYIPGGRYVFGRNDASAIEGPEFSDQVTPFFIDKAEVTNAQYKKFLDANADHAPPTNWVNGAYAEGKGDYPVTGVTWQDAADYAAWAGKRLPTEKEWEAAARSIEGRRYPWGDQWLADAANIAVKSNAKYDEKQYPVEIKPAGQYQQGASREGVLDLVGNVWEWTASPMELYPGAGASLPANVQANPDQFRIIRGGAFDGDKRHDGAYRGYLEKDKAYPKVGFRCVKDAR